MLEFLKEYNENSIYDKAMDCERGLHAHDPITPMATFFEGALKAAYSAYRPDECKYGVNYTFKELLNNHEFMLKVREDYNLSVRDIDTIDSKIRIIRNKLVHDVPTTKITPDLVKECFKCVYKFAAGYYCKVSHQRAPEWSDTKYQELLNSAHSEAEHKERIAECESAIIKLKDDLGDSEKKVSAAQEEIFKLNLQLEEAIQNNADARELEILKSRIDKLENAVNEKQGQVLTAAQHQSSSDDFNGRTSMTELESKIYQAVLNSSGLKAKDIAEKIGTDKQTVNSLLYGSAALKAKLNIDNNYVWHVKTADTDTAAKNEPAQNIDTDLYNLCHYYLDCISLEASSSTSQFLESTFSPKYAVLNGLGIKAGADSSAIELLKGISKTRNAKAYLGYPSRIFTVYGRGGTPYKKIAPVFIFPIEFSAGKIDIIWTPSINMEVLKAFTGTETDSLSIELLKLENELGMNVPDADVDIDELVLRLQEIRKWDWAETIDPYNIPPAASLSRFGNGIYNRPIIIEAESEKYTVGLESELAALAKMSEEDYKGTALHAWIKRDLGSKSSEEIKPILEVLPLNSEQADAVETALKSDLTIVTGPPGTGKSQVVTDLLVNIAWNRKKALFSSKNNKAVDVVDYRVNGLCARPVLLRIGSNKYASRLAEIVEGLLSTRAIGVDDPDLLYYTDEYNDIAEEQTKLKAEKAHITDERNKLDSLEKEYCEYRSIIAPFFDTVSADDLGKLSSASADYSAAYKMAQKANNGLFSRIFWKKIQPKRFSVYCDATNAFNAQRSKFGLKPANTEWLEDEVYSAVNEAEYYDKALAVALKYKEALVLSEQSCTLEEIDRKLADNKKALAKIANQLWTRWLTARPVQLSPIQRRTLADYVAALRLAGDTDITQNDDLKRRYTEVSKIMTGYLQCWAVTSLSAKGRVPFLPGFFDYVIIDEASQCDIASIIPLLYRAKHAVIIGDPQQLNHISQLSKPQDRSLLKKYKLSESWSYSSTSLYALASSIVHGDDIVQLKDHFRSCSDIIDFSNKYFYDGSLRTATRYSLLKTPSGEKYGIRWIDVVGTTERPSTGSAVNYSELETVVKELKRLVAAGYKGSIGVTTPFRKQAEEIISYLAKNEPELYDTLLKYHEFLADTVHKFQGDERDLMIFSTVVSDGVKESTLDFLKNTPNLFNVAITRARAMLIIVGNYSFCKQCNVNYLSKFADYYAALTAQAKKHSPDSSVDYGREYPEMGNIAVVSDWEKKLYTALYDEGIKTIPQYPADRYSLDLAIVKENGRKLDIEVDGAMYHRNWNGELCYRDQLRNQRMFELGWDVKRFWVSQVRDDLPWCIRQIKDWISASE